VTEKVRKSGCPFRSMTPQPAVDNLSPGANLLHRRYLELQRLSRVNSAVLVEHSLRGLATSTQLK